MPLPAENWVLNPDTCPDWESNLSICRLTLKPLSHTSQDRECALKKTKQNNNDNNNNNKNPMKT